MTRLIGSKRPPFWAFADTIASMRSGRRTIITYQLDLLMGLWHRDLEQLPVPAAIDERGLGSCSKSWCKEAYFGIGACLQKQMGAQ